MTAPPVAIEAPKPQVDEAAEARAAAEKAAAERAAAAQAEREAAAKACEEAAAERAAAERKAAEERAAAERAAAEKAAAEKAAAERAAAERAAAEKATAEKAAAENSPEPEPEPKLPAGYVAVETSSLHHRVRTGPMSCPFCDLACKGVKGIKRHLRFCQAANAAGLDKTAVPKGFVVAKVAADGSTNLKRKANEAAAEPEAGARVPARRVAPRRAPAPPILAKPELATEGGEGEERGLGLGSGLDAGDPGEWRLRRDKRASQERRSAELMKINLDLLALTRRVMAMSAEGDGGATR